MMLTTQATARLPFGAPASMSREPAMRDRGFAVHSATGLSCKRTGLGMVASENNAEDLIQVFAPHSDDR